MSEPAKIRNVAVVGHRGTGKTSLVEALLFQTGAINRLGAVEAGTTVSDSDEDEHKRQLSISISSTRRGRTGSSICSMFPAIRVSRVSFAVPRESWRARW
jgi:predicted membrane GTPase involved in stress response